MNIGKRIRQLREKRNMTQEDLAKKVGVATQTIFKYEKEIVTNIPLGKLQTIAIALGTSLSYLLGYGEPVYTDDISENISENSDILLSSKSTNDLTLEWLDNLRKLKDTTTETYKSISEKTKIPQTTIEKIFSGRTKDPKLFMIKEVVHCLGYTLDDLLEVNNSNSTKTIISSENREILMMLNNLNSFGHSKAKEYISLLLLDRKFIKAPQTTFENQYEIAAWGAEGTEGTFETPEEEIT